MANTLSVSQLNLAIDPPSPLLAKASSYRPPSWPPPRDWVCVEDKDGNPVSRWGDPVWDLSPWTNNNRLILNFSDGPKLKKNSVQIDGQNADLFRMAMTWRIWGFQGLRAASSIAQACATLRPVFEVCSQNGILASDLSRYPKVIEKLSGELAPSAFSRVINLLNALFNAREFLGFTILDAAGLAQLKASEPNFSHNQTEYIPPRIWQYQIMRLNQFIDDYISHQQQIEECFAYCISVYSKTRIRKRRRVRVPGPSRHPPFSGQQSVYGTFFETAERFGIKDLLEKWVGLKPNLGVRLISMYLGMASTAGLAYVLNFTLARVSEGMSLRFNCLKWHDDEIFGRTPLIQGQTTKTNLNEAALWVASPSVERAIIVMQSVTKMRSGSAPKKNDEENPHLINHSQEPWTSKGKNLLSRPNKCDYSYISLNPLFFEEDQITITEEDFKIAIAATPTLDQKIFRIGKPWSFSWHQLRRTGAVNMFSSGEISDASIQLQLKHLSPVMTQYYGRGHTTLNLSEDVKSLIVNAQYEAMGKRLAEANTDRFISPFGPDHKERLLSDSDSSEPVNLIAVDKITQYEKAARAHKINFRVTAVGACMKNGRCDGDGFSALGDCAGGDGRAPCANALFDRNRAEANKTRLAMVIKQIESEKPDTPRYRHLEQERRGLENYFAYIR